MAVVRVCMAVKLSVLMRKLRKRMLVSVADIKEARLTLFAWRYLSITACKVSPLADTAVAKVSAIRAPGAMCN